MLAIHGGAPLPGNAALAIVVAHREIFLDRLTARIAEALPRYAQMARPELRASVDGFLDDVVQLVDGGDSHGLGERLVAVAKRRVSQGFAPSDYVGAVLLCFPVLRELLRSGGKEHDPAVARGFAEIEEILHRLAATASSVYAEATARQLEAKNQALERAYQELLAHERQLATEAGRAGRALDAANEFNRRVIESLSSGLLAADFATQRVTLYTSRMEEIVGIPAEEVLGRTVTEAFRGLEGLDVGGMIERVRATGRLPMTKVRLARLDGTVRHGYVRAQRMYDREGEPEGTVVMLDDVTERELLIDSFSRYVSRDVVQRLLARARGPELEGERRTCTVLFADIRGFTGLAERLAPEALHAVLNTYFRVMIDAIAAHGGFVDKFIGDKVMAIFREGAVPEVGAIAACRAAVDLKRNLRSLAPPGGGPRIEVGVGVNTGEVLVGNVGSLERMEFTVIGDPVNVADRLQSLARGAEVFVGARTAELLGDAFPLADRGAHALKGRGAPERVFELLVEQVR